MTERSVLVRRGDEQQFRTPDIGSYTDENHLQDLIARDPARVPGVDDEAVTARELRTSAGPIDVTIVGADGSLTVVECKLASNPERRRMVIGQVIDYAAAIWHDGSEAFLDAWARCGGAGLDDLLGVDGMSNLRANIADGRIGLCLAVDRIDDDLKRLVEYLNQVTAAHVAVSAIQLAYAKHGDVEILIPSTFGGEIAAAKEREAATSTRSSTPPGKVAFVGQVHERIEAPLLAQGWGSVEIGGSGPRISIYPAGGPASRHLTLIVLFPKPDRSQILLRFSGNEIYDAETWDRIVNGFNDRHRAQVTAAIDDPDNVEWGVSAPAYAGTDPRVNRHGVEIGFANGDPAELAGHVIRLAGAYAAALAETDTEFSAP